MTAELAAWAGGPAECAGVEVDAALLLARALTPEPMRPGWTDALRLTRSVLPHCSLTAIDERLAAAAARPVIVPETIVCDHGKAYLSATFRAACRSLGISLAPAHPHTPTDWTPSCPAVQTYLANPSSEGGVLATFSWKGQGARDWHRGQNVSHDSHDRVSELAERWRRSSKRTTSAGSAWHASEMSGLPDAELMPLLHALASRGASGGWSRPGSPSATGSSPRTCAATATATGQAAIRSS